MCVIYIRKWLHKCVLLFLMYHDIVSKAQEDCIIESLGMKVRMWMIRCCCEVFDIEEGYILLMNFLMHWVSYSVSMYIGMPEICL